MTKISPNNSDAPSSKRFVSFQTFTRAFQREGAYLLPLRLFIGIGWLRAGLEKLDLKDWRNGAELSTFFQEQLANDLIVFPFYRTLIDNVFEPNILALCWVIIVGEILVGLAILTSSFTNLALLAGIGVATNFILAGQINPGAFYVVIQLILFIANTGAILGVDYWLSRRIPLSLMVAQPKMQQTYHTVEKWFFMGLVGTLVLAALAVVPYIRSYSYGSVSDPAMVLFVLSLVAAFSFLIAHVRLQRSYLRRATNPSENGASALDSYHLVFCPKFPFYLSSSALRDYTKGLIYQLVSVQSGVEIRALEVKADYVHLVIEITPKYDLSKAVTYIKEKTAIHLTMAYPKLKQSWSVQLWSEGYFETKTDLNELRIRRYIRSQRSKEQSAENKILVSEIQDSADFPLEAKLSRLN